MIVHREYRGIDHHLSGADLVIVMIAEVTGVSLMIDHHSRGGRWADVTIAEIMNKNQEMIAALQLMMETMQDDRRRPEFH